MDETTFWDIIKQSGGDPDRLMSALKERSTEELIQFHNLFRQKMNEAYRWDIWGAGYVINGGLGDDSFMYLLAWLVGRGREAFEAVLADPEALADYEDGDLDGESLMYVAEELYEGRTGQEIPWTVNSPSEPAGEPWEEDEDVLRRLYPKLYAKYR